jgi:hypothetical protein
MFVLRGSKRGQPVFQQIIYSAMQLLSLRLASSPCCRRRRRRLKRHEPCLTPHRCRGAAPEAGRATSVVLLFRWMIRRPSRFGSPVVSGDGRLPAYSSYTESVVTGYGRSRHVVDAFSSPNASSCWAGLYIASPRTRTDRRKPTKTFAYCVGVSTSSVLLHRARCPRRPWQSTRTWPSDILHVDGTAARVGWSIEQSSGP